MSNFYSSQYPQMRNAYEMDMELTELEQERTYQESLIARSGQHDINMLNMKLEVVREFTQAINNLACAIANKN